MNDEYTYHKHSEEKNMIYFRCSDKKCKARALFNKLTENFTFKNDHLSLSVHKPNSSKAISGYQISKVLSLVKGPISLVYKKDDPAALICDESPFLSSATENSEAHFEVLLKFSINDDTLAEKFCKKIADLNLAVRAEILLSAKKSKIGEECEKRRGFVEVKTFESAKNKVLALAQQDLGEISVESFRRLN